MFQPGSGSEGCDGTAASSDEVAHLPVRAAAAHAGRPAWVLAPLRGLLQRLARLTLRAGSQVPLVPPVPGQAQPRVAQPAGDAPTMPGLDLLPQDEAERHRMLRALGRLLDQHPAARSLFPSLALVELELRCVGELDQLPTDVVRDASTLLVQLAGENNSDGLALLRGRLRRLRAAHCLSPL